MKNENTNSRATIRERICNALDIVPDTMPRTGMIEIRGRNSVCIKEGGRILSYTPDRISVQMGGGDVEIRGERLVCTAYRRGTVRIDGYIFSVGFLEV